MAEVNFLRFSFFANTSLGHTNQDTLVRGWLLLFIHTCSGRAQKIPFSLATLDTRGGKMEVSSRKRMTCWSPGCEELLVAGWLASGHPICT